MLDYTLYKEALAATGYSVIKTDELEQLRYECNKSTNERNESRRQLQACRRERDDRSAIIKEAHKVIQKEAESYAIHGIQPPPYITKWLAESEIE